MPVQQATQNITENVVQKVDEYTTIASAANTMFVDFMQQLPYFIVALVVFSVFWGLSYFFKKTVNKLLGSRQAHRNLIQVFQRVGGALILFVGFMVAMVIAVPGFTPAKLVGALGLVRWRLVLPLKTSFKICCLVFCCYCLSRFALVTKSSQAIMKARLKTLRCEPPPLKLMMVGKW